MQGSRTVLVAIGFAVASISPTAGRADEDAAAVIAKAIKAQGGEEKLAKMSAQTWKVKATFHGLGMKLPYTADYAFQAPDKFRFDMRFVVGEMKMEMSAAFDGKKGWEKSGDTVQDMPEKKLAEFKNQIYTMWVSHLAPLKGKGFTLTSLGESKDGERKLVGVKVSRKGHGDVSLFFDKETGLLAKTAGRVWDEFSDKEVPQEVIFTEYREAGGVKQFGKMAIKRDGKLFLEEEFSDMKASEKLDPKLFARP